ncbi:hypothetical protein D3C74_439000 [compost metagenome]
MRVFGPTPSIWSSWEAMLFLARTWRWKVIAKRWTSSWIRCTRWKAWLFGLSSTISSFSPKMSEDVLCFVSLTMPATGMSSPSSSSSTSLAACTWTLPPSIRIRSGIARPSRSKRL